MNVKFFFLNILKTTHNSVRERVKNVLSRTLLHLVFKIFKKKYFTFIKSANLVGLLTLPRAVTVRWAQQNFSIHLILKWDKYWKYIYLFFGFLPCLHRLGSKYLTEYSPHEYIQLYHWIGAKDDSVYRSWRSRTYMCYSLRSRSWEVEVLSVLLIEVEVLVGWGRIGATCQDQGPRSSRLKRCYNPNMSRELLVSCKHVFFCLLDRFLIKLRHSTLILEEPSADYHRVISDAKHSIA